MKQSTSNVLYELWKLFAVLGMIITVIPSLVSIFFIVKGLVNGEFFSRDSLFVYIMEGPSYTYHDMYIIFTEMLTVTAPSAIAWIYDLDYLSAVKQAGTWFPDSKSQKLIAAGILHLIALLILCLVYIL